MRTLAAIEAMTPSERVEAVATLTTLYCSRCGHLIKSLENACCCEKRLYNFGINRPHRFDAKAKIYY